MRGLEAIEKLQGASGICIDDVIFHQLDVTDSTSIASLAAFVKSQIGKLDILVNNAAMAGGTTEVKDEDLAIEEHSFQQGPLIQTYKLAEECLETNYYGAKKMIEALAPLLQLSDLPRIVNVSSGMGKLKRIKNQRIKEVFSDVEKLTEERVDEVLNEFLKDFKQGFLETNGWPLYAPAYSISKAAMDALTKIMAKKYPSFCVNSVCPGYTETDLTLNNGLISPAEGAECPVELALVPNGGPSGLFIFGKSCPTEDDAKGGCGNCPCQLD